MRDNNVSTAGNIGDAEDLFECKINTSKDFSLPQLNSHENFVHLENFLVRFFPLANERENNKNEKRER